MSSVDHGFNDQQYQLFFYPLGLAVGEERDNPTLPVNAEVINRPRSASNATQDVADIRGSMTKSVTDLFVDIGFVDDDGQLVPRNSPFPSIADLLDGLKYRGEDNITVFKYDWVGGVYPRTLSRPHTAPQLPMSGAPIVLAPEDEIHQDAMYIYSMLQTSANIAWKRTLATAFADGDIEASSHISATALISLGEAASTPEYRSIYRILFARPVLQWLTENDEAFWDCNTQTVRASKFATLMRNETLNYCHQKYARLIRHCHIGARIVPQSYSYLAGSPEAKLYPAQSRPPGQHARQAAELLAQICGIDRPEDLRSNNLFPGVDFFVGPAVERLATGAIYEVGIEVFAIMVQSVMDKEKDEKYTPPPGEKWMPLHLLSFAATFLLLDLIRIAGLTNMFGMDACKSASLSSPSTTQGLINRNCIHSLRLIYNFPATTGPGYESRRKIRNHLCNLELMWQLGMYHAKHKANVGLDLPQYSRCY